MFARVIKASHLGEVGRETTRRGLFEKLCNYSILQPFQLPQSPYGDSSAVNFYEIIDFGSFDTGIISQIKDLDNAPPQK